jgi:hypothetical protein
VLKGMMKPRRFPSGWLVVAVLIASGVLWAVLFFVTLPHLRALASAAAPFDVRPFGYDYAEAGAFLSAIGSQGRAYYVNPELVLDTFYPPLYATSRALTLWWLTMPGRLREEAWPLSARWTLAAIPVVVAGFDGVENISIAHMIWTWPDLSAGLVALASMATRAKLLLGGFTKSRWSFWRLPLCCAGGAPAGQKLERRSLAL